MQLIEYTVLRCPENCAYSLYQSLTQFNSRIQNRRTLKTYHQTYTGHCKGFPIIFEWTLLHLNGLEYLVT